MCARNSLLLEMQFWYKTALLLLSRENSSYIAISEGLVFAGHERSYCNGGTYIIVEVRDTAYNTCIVRL